MFFFFHLVFYILLIKPRIFNISSPIPHLLQILERSNVSSQTYDILDVLNSLYFLHLIDFSHPNLFEIYSQKGFFNY